MAGHLPLLALDLCSVSSWKWRWQVLKQQVLRKFFDANEAWSLPRMLVARLMVEAKSLVVMDWMQPIVVMDSIQPKLSLGLQVRFAERWPGETVPADAEPGYVTAPVVHLSGSPPVGA